MFELIKRNAGGKKVVILFILANLVYACMIFITIPRVMLFSGGLKLFDMMPMGYDLPYAVALLEKLGAEGRSVYLTQQLPLDMIYPGLSGIAYCLMMAWLFAKLGLTRKFWMFLCLLPLAAGLFDYLENIGTIMMLKAWPDVSAVQVGIANAFTIIKSVLSTAFFVILIVAFFSFLILKLRYKLKPSGGNS